MGLHIHSLNNVPVSENKDYLIYLLDYGWDEPLATALRNNYDEMAKKAALNRAVVIRGTELSHFENEVFSWHKINNENGEDILPAILITNAHPSYFFQNSDGYHRERGLYRETENGDLKLILVPLKRFCQSTTEVIDLITKLFKDIEEGVDLSDFRVAKEVRKGIGSAIVDSIILEPNISGIGFSFKRIKEYFGGK